MARYEVIRPEESQRFIGRSYQDLLESWVEWLVSDNPDAHNYGNVIFLRGIDFPESPETTAKIGYSGQPAIMVGTRSLNITTDQYLFLPVIVTMVTDIDDHAKTSQERSYLIWRDNREGDNPPSTEQILIDNKPLTLKKEQRDEKSGQEIDLSAFLTWTKDFTLHVPNVSYSRSLKDYLDIPMTTPGDRQAMAAGFCILFKFKDADPKPHSLIFQARGIRGSFGQYFASGVYTIYVSHPATTALPALPTPLSQTVAQRMLRVLDNRKQKNEILDDEYVNLKKSIESYIV
jgi:hypothetical protein